MICIILGKRTNYTEAIICNSLHISFVHSALIVQLRPGTLRSYCVPNEGNPGYPGTSRDNSDLGHWDLTVYPMRASQDILGHPWTTQTWDTGILLCTQSGHPRITWDIPGQLRPGTLDLTVYQMRASQDIIQGQLRPGTLGSYCVPNEGIPGYPGTSLDNSDLGHWDVTVYPMRISWDIPGQLRPGTLGSYCVRNEGIPGYPGTSLDNSDLGHWILLCTQ